MVSGHLIDMIGPHLVEGFQDERSLCIGVLCVGKSGVANAAETGGNAGLRHAVRRPAQAVREHLDAVQLHGHFVTLGAHSLGQILLHILRISLLLCGQQAGDCLYLLFVQLVGVCRFGVGQGFLAEHKATVFDVIPGAFSAGVGVQTHHLAKRQLELLAGVVHELTVNLLVDIPVVVAVLLDHLVTEGCSFPDVLHDDVLGISQVHDQLGEHLGTDTIQRIVQLLIVPADLVGQISGDDRQLLVRDLTATKVLHDGRSHLLDGLGSALDVELIRITDIGKNHGVCTEQPIQFLNGHVCSTHILQDLNLFIGHERSQRLLQHLVIGCLYGILGRVFELRIETLKQCPEDYIVKCSLDVDICSVGIDHQDETVNLFSE